MAIKTVNGEALPIPANGLVWLSTVTASASATVDIETTFSSTYDNYVIIGTNIVCSVNGSQLYCRPKVGGVYDDTTSNFFCHVADLNSNSAAYAANANNGAQGQWAVLRSVSNVAAQPASLNMYIYRPATAANMKSISWHGVTRQSAGTTCYDCGSGQHTNTANALTGIRFLPDSGTITTGTFRLYGIANS